MKIDFYGSRGSIPSPLTLSDYQSKVKSILHMYKQSQIKDVDEFFTTLPSDLSHIYGGNSSCICIEGKNDDMLILDAGSGLRELGKKLADKNNMTIHILFSHFHWDHICGIPFFKPIYNPTNTIVFYSTNNNMIDNLARQQHSEHFPMPFDKLPAKKKFVFLDKENPFRIGDFTIFHLALSHPGGSTGYVIQSDGKKVSYATDAEFTPDNVKEKDLFYKACFESSDVLIMDSQYSLIEFFQKFDWGHTSSTMAVNLALEWRVKKLVLFHFDPDHKDIDLIKILNETKQLATKYNKRKLEIVQAIEGTSIEL